MVWFIIGFCSKEGIFIAVNITRGKYKILRREGSHSKYRESQLLGGGGGGDKLFLGGRGEVPPPKPCMDSYDVQ